MSNIFHNLFYLCILLFVSAFIIRADREKFSERLKKKFTNLNKNKKFELVIQGNYSKLYKETKDLDLMNVQDINVEEIIRSRISEAYIINE